MPDSHKKNLPERYEIISELGSGGGGTVYKAFDKVLDKDVAIKTLKFISDIDHKVIRFQKEAKAAACLHHENICTLMDFGFSEEQVPYMVLEFIDGSTLQSIVEEQGALSPVEAVPIFCQIASALVHAHSKGIVHRDIKSANIIVSINDGSPQSKLFDFGIAQINAPEKSMDLTHTNTMIGSPPYMSPEQVRGETADERSDFYSFGCVMFETLTGSPPFESSNSLALLEMHMNEKPPSVSEKTTQTMPAGLENVIDKCLEKSASNRFQTAQELLEALEGVLSDPMFEVRDNSDDTAGSAPLFSFRSNVEKTEEEQKAIGTKERQWKFILTLSAVLSLILVYFVLNPILKTEQSEHTSEPPQPIIGDTDFSTGVGPVSLQQGDQKESILEVLEDNSAAISSLNSFLGKDIHTIKFSYEPSDECLRQVIKFRHLTQIDSPGGLSAKHIRMLSVLQSLDIISIGSIAIDKETIQAIAQLSSLKLVIFNHCQSVDGSSLDQLSPLKSLHMLSIKNSKVLSGIPETITRLKVLKVLEVERAGLTDDDIKRLTGLPINQLSLAYNHELTRKSLDYASEFRNLARLTLVDCVNIGEDAVRAFKKSHPKIIVEYRMSAKGDQASENRLDPKELASKVTVTQDQERALALRGIGPFGTGDLREIGKLNLAILDVESNRLDDSALMAVGKMKTLTTLDASDNPITAIGIRALKDMPALKSLCLGGKRMKFTPQEFQAISSLKHLETLFIQNCDSIDSESLDQLNKLKSLDTLIFTDCKLNHKHLEAIKKLKGLHYLTMEGAGLGDSHARQIAEFSNIESIRLDNNLFSDRAFESFGQMKNLKSLSLEPCRNMTDEGREKFQQFIWKTQKRRILF